jgi:hypothetical protein
MPSSRGIRAGAAYVEIFTDDSRLIRGLARASRRLKTFGAAVQSLSSGMMGWGTRLIATSTAILAPLAAAAKTFADTGDAFGKMAKRTGISAEVLSELAFAAGRSGTNVETLEVAIKKMQKAIVGAATGSKTAVKMLGQLGLTVDEFDALSPDAQFKLCAERISQIEDPTIRAAAALQLFGRSGTSLLPMINNGAKGIEALELEARRLGLTISTGDAVAAEAFNDILGDTWAVVKRAAFEIGASLAPALTDAAHTTIDLVRRASAWVAQNRGLIVSVLKVAAGVAAAGAALVALSYAVSAVGAGLSILGSVLGAAGAALAAIGTIVGFILSPLGLAVTAAAALGSYLVWASGAGGRAIAWLRDRFNDLKTEVGRVAEGIMDALAVGDINLAAELVWLTLKMWWKRGVLWLKNLWLDWKDHFLDVANAAWVDYVQSWRGGCKDIRTVWAETWATIQTIAATTWAVLGTMFLKLSEGMAKAWIAMQETLGMVTPEAAKAWRANVKHIYAQILAETFLKPGAKAIKHIESELETKRREYASPRQAAAVVLAPELAAVAAAQKALDDARAKAREQRVSAEQAALMTPELPKVAAKFGGLKNLMADVEKSIAGRGTFSAIEAAAVAAGGVADRIAAAGEKTAKNTKKIADWTDDAEATFD